MVSCGKNTTAKTTSNTTANTDRNTTIRIRLRLRIRLKNRYKNDYGEYNYKYDYKYETNTTKILLHRYKFPYFMMRATSKKDEISDKEISSEFFIALY